jgi:hypothetical protein
MASNPSQDIGLVGNDLMIADGDFVIALSDDQHIIDTINAFPGWWKENPPDGVGALQYLNSSGQEQTIQRAVKIQLQSDGYSVNSPVATTAGGTVTIQPNATKQ